MKLSELKRALLGLFPIDTFESTIDKEVNNYKSSLKIKGTSTPIYLIEDDRLFVGKNELKKLCSLYLSGGLSEGHLNYIVDAILLSNNVDFENEDIKEQIELLTDPEINGSLSPETVNQILDGLE